MQSGSNPGSMPAYAANAIYGQNNNNNINDRLSMAGGVGGALGALGGGLFNLFGGNQNPADAAMPYFNKIPGQVAPYFNPYIQAGQGALGQLQGQYGNLINNPAGVMNQIGQGYHASPGYQWQLGQALQAGNQSAAAGGMLGSPASQQNQMQTAQGLANQDYYNYINQGLNQYNRGLTGLEGLNNTGFNASTGMANSLANLLAQQGNLAYTGQQNQNQSQGGGFGSALGGLGSLASLFML